ncbi:MAG TPA: polymer-forming cytoskeletal protein [Alphaproteobacteria bacterium]|nr:polymer-forming cytoskeletal protein [Alphaproteobacteria bacterium]
MFGQSERKAEEEKSSSEDTLSNGAGSEISGRLVRPLRPTSEEAASDGLKEDEAPLDLTAIDRETSAPPPQREAAYEPEPEPEPQPAQAPEANTDQEGRIVVGAGVKIVGEIRDCREIEIFGIVDGDLEVEDLLVHENGLLKGNVKADRAEVRGAIEGEVAVKELLDVKAKGSVAGKTAYGALSIETGGRVVGTLDDGVARPAPSYRTSTYKPLGDTASPRLDTSGSGAAGTATSHTDPVT